MLTRLGALCTCRVSVLGYGGLRLTKTGNCKTLMVTCCSPSCLHVSESLRSLQFASRAKHIRNKPIVILDAKESLIQVPLPP